MKIDQWQSVNMNNKKLINYGFKEQIQGRIDPNLTDVHAIYTVSKGVKIEILLVYFDIYICQFSWVRRWKLIIKP